MSSSALRVKKKTKNDELKFYFIFFNNNKKVLKIRKLTHISAFPFHFHCTLLLLRMQEI